VCLLFQVFLWCINVSRVRCIYLSIYNFAAEGLQSIVMSMSVFVCVSVCSHNSKMHGQTSPNFWRILPMATARSHSDSIAICYVLPVGRWAWHCVVCHMAVPVGVAAGWAWATAAH